MKNLILLLILLISSNIFSQTNKELEMISLINQVRSNPKSFISEAESRLELLNNKKNKSNLVEDIKATKELIRLLNKIKKMDTLTFNKDMYIVTKSHGEYLNTVSKSNKHISENGDYASNRMKHIVVENVSENTVNDNNRPPIGSLLLLLVDWPHKDRGHRNNILNPNSTYISVYTNGRTWIMNFAN